MVQKLILLLIFALPFFIGPIGINFFETPKIYGALLLIELLTIISLFTLNLKQKFMLSKLDYLLISLFTFVTLQFIFYPNTFAFFGNEFRKQGVFLLWHLIIFAYIVSKVPVFNKRLQFVASRISLLALLASTFFFGTSVDERAVGVLGEPNSLGIYAAFLWPLTGNLWFAIPAFLVMLLSGSRSAFIAFGIQGLFLLLTKKFHLPIRLSIIPCLLLIVFCLLLPFLETTAEYQNRPLIWKTAFTAGMQKPITGWGFGNTETGIKWAAEKLENPLRFEYVDQSHNILLDWFVQGGIMGAFFFIAITGITLFNITSTQLAQIQNPNVKIQMAFLALLTGLLFNPVSVAILIPFWWIIGVSGQKEV
jgi:O-antigen ligase